MLCLGLGLAALAPAAAPARASTRQPARAAARPAAESREGTPPKPAETAAAPTPTHVEAANIEYLYKERRTVMTGKPLVKLRRDDATLVCHQMVADNDEAGDIRTATCEGDVKLSRGEQTVTCREATYDAAAGTIVCRGDGVLVDGATVLRASEFTYELGRDRVVAKDVKGTVYRRPGQKLPGARERSR